MDEAARLKQDIINMLPRHKNKRVKGVEWRRLQDILIMYRYEAPELRVIKRNVEKKLEENNGHTLDSQRLLQNQTGRGAGAA